jgi:hypothetical protein
LDDIERKGQTRVFHDLTVEFDCQSVASGQPWSLITTEGEPNRMKRDDPITVKRMSLLSLMMMVVVAVDQKWEKSV